jgi:hypothetical protein
MGKRKTKAVIAASGKLAATAIAAPARKYLIIADVRVMSDWLALPAGRRVRNLIPRAPAAAAAEVDASIPEARDPQFLQLRADAAGDTAIPWRSCATSATR